MKTFSLGSVTIFLPETDEDAYLVGARSSVEVWSSPLMQEAEDESKIEKADNKPGWHDHNGSMTSHPVAVKNHEEYFAQRHSNTSTAHNEDVESGWRPSMNEEDAKEYVKGSVFDGRVFHHYTQPRFGPDKKLHSAEDVAKEIRESGFKPSEAGKLGEGVYLTEGDAKSVNRSDGEDVRVYVRVDKPFEIDAWKFDKMQRTESTIAVKKFLDGLRNDYDSILFSTGGAKWLVVFDEKNIVAVKEDGDIRKSDEESEPPDPIDGDYYRWMDEQIHKASPGDPRLPYGARSTGMGIERHLYTTLRQTVQEYIQDLKGTETQDEINKGIEAIINRWYEENKGSIETAFTSLFQKGLAAGAISAGQAASIRAGKLSQTDKLAIDILAKGKYRIGERINLFAKEAVGKFAKVIEDAYNEPGKGFSIEYLVKAMNKEVQGSRERLRVIARSEVGQVSGIGRLWGWSQGGEDSLYYDYMWLAKVDNVTRSFKIKRMNDGPYSLDEIKFLFMHNSERDPRTGMFILGVPNCRCAISRSPRNTQRTGNRFIGKESDYQRTVELDF